MKKIITLISFISICSLAIAQGGWTKISSGPIASFSTPGIYKGAAWVDFNNDGFIDLFAMPNLLFKNDGTGNFTKMNYSNINPNPLQFPGGCSWGDINNDGYIDFITAQSPSEIYINNGSDSFINYTAQMPGLLNYASWGCALADINNDSKLDLLYVHANGFHSGAGKPCKLYIQDIDSFSFKAITNYDFTNTTAPYTVPYFADYDLDGDVDLFIASGPGGSAGPDFHYKNMWKENGTHTFEKMTTEPWAAQNQDGQCYNFIDYDLDGDLDVCLTNYAGASTRFYKNNGNNSYQSITTPFTTSSQKLSNSWADFDNDGDEDVFISRDNGVLSYYRNNGDGSFNALITMAVPASNSCVISGDYDNDGDLDVFVHGTDNAKSLWRNDTLAANRNWVNYNFKGVMSNKSAIGTIIKLKTTMKGKSVWQTRMISAQNSFQGQNDLRVHFGLNDATVVERIEILWPSGLREYYENKSVNVFENIIEGNGTFLSINNNKKTSLVKVYPNPSKGIVNIEPLTNLKTFQLSIIDFNGRLILDIPIINDVYSLDTSLFSKGTYILRIAKDDELYFEKIIVE